MDVHEASHYQGWYDNLENPITHEQDVAGPMYRMQMNSLLYHSERDSSSMNVNVLDKVHDKVLLDMDKHELTMKTDEMPLNLSVSSFRPSVIQSSSPSSSSSSSTTKGDPTSPTDVDEHFRRSLNGYYQRRRRSEQIRISPLISPPSNSSRSRSPNVISSLRSQTAANPCHRAKSSASGGRRRASCIPDVMKQMRCSSPDLPMCVVSLSESAAISVAGSVDDHFAKSLGSATWTELKCTSSISVQTTPTTNKSRHHQPWLSETPEAETKTTIPDDTQVQPDVKPEAIFKATEDTKLINNNDLVKVKEDQKNSSEVFDRAVDSVDEHFRKALGLQTWNLLATKV